MPTQDSRIRIKRSTTAGVEPSIPASTNHLDGSWVATDLYMGEFMTNVVDERVWFRASTAIVELAVKSETFGTYTPTYGTPAQGSIDTIYDCQYMRVGNVVTVSGMLGYSSSDGTDESFTMSLPINSAMTDGEENAGGAACGFLAIGQNLYFSIYGGSSANTVIFKGFPNLSGGTFKVSFSYTYIIN